MIQENPNDIKPIITYDEQRVLMLGSIQMQSLHSSLMYPPDTLYSAIDLYYLLYKLKFIPAPEALF